MTESEPGASSNLPRGPRGYELGNPQLDETIRQLVADAADGTHPDLIAEMIVTVLRLHRDKASRGDLKLINTALKEMRYSLLVFGRHFEPKVTIFGSARIPPDDPNYHLATEFGRLMAEKGWGVITGAGPGIMEAGAQGAERERAYGVNIRLPFEADANRYLSPERTVNYKYFFTRKLTFVKESAAFALFPGGFGTLDEAFELFTLMQTGKSDLHPVVLLEAPGTGYWQPLLDFLGDVLAARGLISPPDLNLFRTMASADDAVDHILSFYSNYHSQRFVEGRLVLRLHHPPSAQLVTQLNQDFSDLLASGRIELVEPSNQEVADSDALDLARLALNFDRHSFGRLRQLIDRLNEMVETPEKVEPPAPFDEEQAERPW
ncbi:MAG TPA: TIGR00730 family Rossman fold protein [Acidimicrobiia bacterium]|nr:TIGR00730 family Rossman fold protein [Acidimicrobiia bacterium]